LAARFTGSFSQARFISRFASSRRKGATLTHEESSASYVIIRHNVRTYESAGVVEVIKGLQNAETAVKKFQAQQGSSDHHEGWRYFLEKTDLKAGLDPAKATHMRQADLEGRETKAAHDADILAQGSVRNNTR
jgi:hypothetical protein